MEQKEKFDVQNIFILYSQVLDYSILTRNITNLEINFEELFKNFDTLHNAM